MFGNPSLTNRLCKICPLICQRYSYKWSGLEILFQGLMPVKSSQRCSEAQCKIKCTSRARECVRENSWRNCWCRRGPWAGRGEDVTGGDDLHHWGGGRLKGDVTGLELKSGGGRGSEAASGRQLLEQVVGLKGLGQNGFFFFLCKKSIGITRPSRWLSGRRTMGSSRRSTTPGASHSLPIFSSLTVVIKSLDVGTENWRGGWIKFVFQRLFDIKQNQTFYFWYSFNKIAERRYAKMTEWMDNVEMAIAKVSLHQQSVCH